MFVCVRVPFVRARVDACYPPLSFPNMSFTTPPPPPFSDCLSVQRHQTHQRSCRSHQNAPQNRPRQIPHPWYARAALLATLRISHLPPPHTHTTAVLLADRCMRSCGSAFHAAVAASLLSRLVKASRVSSRPATNATSLYSDAHLTYHAFCYIFDPCMQIGLEARSQDASSSQLQWECCRCVQSWGTELLPRLGQYAEAARRVAAKNAAAARMTQHVEQQWPKSARQADEMSSVGSLSSVSTATSSASINTLYPPPLLSRPTRVQHLQS